ncbi:MAG TPA: N-acetylglucosamine-6-phosphate deacetylase [Terracidiphilus sp.]|nr:N-acetylglucosamine-6-phosphate deacetylase [Terracidiphilus sp.]
MRTIVTADRLWNGVELIEQPLLEIEGGRIAAIGSRASAAEPVPCGVKVLRFPGATLAPSFFDVHFHGAAGHDVMEATPEAIAAIGTLLARHGTAAYLATTVTAPLDATLRAVAGLAELIEKPERIHGQRGEGCARPIGIHLEGPFLSHARRGVQPAEHLLAPDIDAFDRLYEAGGGHVRLMTLAPELPGAIDLARHATERGVRVSLGHSNAGAAETRAAIDAGAASATHTFNAMRPLDHREPGILGVVLTDDRLYAELICDGIHSDPQMAKLWWRSKGESRGILITDAMSAAGMPDGEYRLGGFAVQVAGGRAMAGGVLAGSVLTLDRALSNFVRFTGAPLDKALRLLTVNPAAMLGIDGQAGTLAVGAPANLVAVDAAGKLAAAMVDGQLSSA